MTTTQALYVLEVAAARSVSGAARRLYVTQSAISQQIQRLEQELGCSLFTRTVYGLELTRDGENFCRQARPVIDAWQKLCADLHADNLSAKKQLRLALGSRVYSNSLFADIVRFFDSRPELEVSFRTEAGMDFLQALRQQQVDLVLDRLPTEDYLARQTEYYDLPLVRERQCVLMDRRDPRAGLSGMAFADLEGATVISGLENSAEDRQLRELCSRYGIALKRIYRSDGIDTNMKLVRGGVGVVLGPASFARYYNVAAVPLEPETEASLRFVCLKTLLQRREIRQLRDHLLQACRDHKLLTAPEVAD
jgi:DNA-binding transcriptional LysR family regulator